MQIFVESGGTKDILVVKVAERLPPPWLVPLPKDIQSSIWSF